MMGMKRIESNFGKRRRLAFGLGIFVVLMVSSSAVMAAAKTNFRPGLYLGKTSQGEAVRLKLVGCGSGQCLETPDEQSYFSVDLACPSSGQTEEEIIYLPKNTIAKSGVVDVLGGFKPGATVKIKVARNGTLSGKIHLRETLETGTRCDSGEVTLKAKIGGRTS